MNSRTGACLPAGRSRLSVKSDELTVNSKIRLIFIFLFCLLVTSCINYKSTPQEEINPKVLILYDSRYGSTELIAYWIAVGIGSNAKVKAIQAVKNSDFEGDDFVFLGSPIFKANITEKMSEFIELNRIKLKDKQIGLFVVCGTYLVHGDLRIKEFEDKIGKKAVIKKAFGGRLIPEKLNQEDKKRLKNYWDERGVKEIKGFDYLSREEAEKFGEMIKEKIFPAAKISTPDFSKPTTSIDLPEKNMAETARGECYEISRWYSAITLNMAEYARIKAEEALEKGNFKEARDYYISAKNLYYQARIETMVFKDKERWEKGEDLFLQ